MHSLASNFGRLYLSISANIVKKIRKVHWSKNNTVLMDIDFYSIYINDLFSKYRKPNTMTTKNELSTCFVYVIWYLFKSYTCLGGLRHNVNCKYNVWMFYSSLLHCCMKYGHTPITFLLVNFAYSKKINKIERREILMALFTSSPYTDLW